MDENWKHDIEGWRKSPPWCKEEDSEAKKETQESEETRGKTGEIKKEPASEEVSRDNDCR